MKYVGYEWDCSNTGIVLDDELNTDKLGWDGGDYFKLINENGHRKLVKVDPIEKFIITGSTKGN